MSHELPRQALTRLRDLKASAGALQTARRVVQCASGATDEPCVSRLFPRFLRRATSSGVATETGLNSELLLSARMPTNASLSAIGSPTG